MDESLFNQIIEDRERLLSIVSQHSTYEIVGWCANYLNSHYKIKLKNGLGSPIRQSFYLLGLMLNTAKPKEPIGFGEKEWNNCVKLLNSIASSYIFMYWPSIEDDKNVSDRWKEIIDVVEPTFLDYFNTGLLATTEQVISRIEKYISPFDISLKKKLNFNSTETIQVVKWITERLHGSMDELMELSEKTKIIQSETISEAVKRDLSIEETREISQTKENIKTFTDYFNSIDNLFQINIDCFRKSFNNRIVNNFIKTFVSKRGKEKETNYYTERNIAEKKPLFFRDNAKIIIPSISVLHWAILYYFEDILSSDASIRSKYFRHRDKTLENQSFKYFSQLLGDSAEYFCNVYETEELENEHDLVVKWNNYLLVIESKASPPIEPFRDPKKAFNRIKNQFKSDRGIQSAFDQANSMQKIYNSDKDIELYNDKKERVLHINKNELNDIFCICVTRDSFGPLATDLSLLLEKSNSDPYPWAINIFDLESVVDGWNYFNWDASKFITFLNNRRKLHGKIFSTDELDIIGYYIKHGGFKKLLESKADTMVIDYEYSMVFDEIYQAKKGGKPVKYKPTEPFVGDMREMLFNEFVKKEGKSKINITTKQGRNELCACGSGKKFKKCCGSKIQ